MSRKIPPLNALRSFEAAARLLSFKKAANELCVTNSAVSHQIQRLEDYLNIRLFHRLNRKLVLTDAGALYLAKVQKIFDGIDEATRDVSEWTSSDILSLAIPPSLLANWMIYRLQSFMDDHPDIQLRLVDTLRPVNFREEKIDAAISYGYGDWPGLHIEHLMDELMVPVCSPELLKGEYPLSTPHDLIHHTLIHTERRLIRWDNVLRTVEFASIDRQKGLRFLHSIHSIQAAIEGLGVALANRITVVDHLDSGALVMPFELPHNVQNTPGYYFVCPQENHGLPKVMAFKEWVFAQF